ncbi:MAG: L,D-transpeptidase family protein [Gammaproteobacteria bacterium]|jgi:murein L,D-transpeptidase YafK
MRAGYSVFLIVIILLLMPANALAIQKADFVLVVKSKEKLFLIKEDKIIKAYNVVFGANPKGHKQQEGDERTPEGRYILDFKKSDSAFYKAIRISYPNEQDREHAARKGVDPGGQIMIHGQKNGYGWMAPVMQTVNWTDGCIAVTNREMEEIWQAVDVGTPIVIKP